MFLLLRSNKIPYLEYELMAYNSMNLVPARWEISGGTSDHMEANAAESQCYLPTLVPHTQSKDQSPMSAYKTILRGVSLETTDSYCN